MKSKSFSHLKHFQDYLREHKIEGVLIEEMNDLFYLTGMHFSAGSLIVTPRSARLFVDGRYIQVAKEKAPMSAVLTDEKKMTSFLKQANVKRLYIDDTSMSYGRFAQLKKLVPLKPIDRPLKEVRLIKDAQEIAALKRSAALLWKGFNEIKRHLKVGVTEIELARRFEIFSLENGAEKLSFDPIIAFGAHSAHPHYHVSNTKLKKGDTVLVDIGVFVDNYASDMTRTLFFGPPQPKMKHLFEVVFSAQKEALAQCKPGVKLKTLDEAARAVMKEAKLEKYYPHGLGHGVGLEVHEHPRISIKGKDKELKLMPGMVFTIEPGLYIPKLGGVRYEDTVIVTPKGHDNLYPEMDLDHSVIHFS